MPEVIEQVVTGIKDTANEGVNSDPLIPRRMGKTVYITETEERPQQHNEFDSFTKKEKILRFKLIFSITSDPIEEFDLAPELSISEAAEIAKKFINAMPSDIIDVDLGSGF